MKRRDQPLRTEIKDGKLIVSIGVSTLAFAATQYACQEAYEESEGESEEPSFKIADEDEWANDVRLALSREREDGSSPLTDLFDAMFKSALNDGAQGVEYIEQGSASGVPCREEKP